MGVLDWRGPEFLVLYALLLAGVVILSMLLHTDFRPPDDAPDMFSARLQPLEIAYLAGGPLQALDVAVTSLRYGTPAAAGDRGPTLDDQRLKDAPPLERALYALAADKNLSETTVRREADVILAPVRSRLTWLKFLVPPRHTQWVQRVQATLFMGLLALGIAKVAVGVSRGRPVTFLVLAWVVTLILLIYFVSRPPPRSRRGDRALEQLKAKNIALMWTAGHQPHRLATGDVTLAVALFGGEALGGTLAAIALPSHLRAAQRQRAAAGSHSCSGCGGSGCGGSGCGGGGGGGCGGCGS